ncbi:MAG: hypothetical protein IK082_06565 [Oscillospiraceae bacterium]|nr:hypothetical protein [Oscillospiraceae bacterium]
MMQPDETKKPETAEPEASLPDGRMEDVSGGRNQLYVSRDMQPHPHDYHGT